MENVIVCQKCLGELEEKNNNAVCFRCNASFRIKDSVYYFTEIKNQIIPSKMREPSNPQTWSDWRKKNFAFLQDNLSGLRKDSYVLDIGAGQGHFRNLFENCNYFTVDFYNYPGIKIVADITRQLPFQSNSFDYLVLSNVLEHIKEPKKLLKECYRVLKKKGRIIILIPFMIKIHQPPYDFNRYTHFMLKYLMEENNFSNIKITNIGNIFDIQKVVNESYFGIIKENLVKLIPNKYFRLIPRIIIEMINFEFKVCLSFLNRFLNKPNLNSNKQVYIQGYGVVAEK